MYFFSLSTVFIVLLIIKTNDMKTLNKIKLNQLRKAELEQRAMNALKGGSGACAVCGCTNLHPAGPDYDGNKDVGTIPPNYD